MKNRWAAAALACLAAAPAPALARGRAGRGLEGLGASQGEERLRLISRLGRERSREAVAPLLELFDIRRAGPRESAAVIWALGRIGDESAAPALVEAWDYLAGVRLAMELPPALEAARSGIVESLGLVGGRRSAAVVLDALEDADDSVVEAAARAAGRLRERRAVPRLAELTARRGAVAQAAFEALAEIRDGRVRPDLKRAAAGDDPPARASAGYALARLGDASGRRTLRALIEPSDRPGPASILAAYYLVKLGDEEGLDHLLLTLSARDERLRAQAAMALGRAGSRRAVAPLGELLDRGEEAGVRLLAAQSLGMLGGRKARFLLHRARDDDRDPSVRRAAELALDGLEGD